jgi:hypothetical protein
MGPFNKIQSANYSFVFSRRNVANLLVGGGREKYGCSVFRSPVGEANVVKNEGINGEEVGNYLP